MLGVEVQGRAHRHVRTVTALHRSRSQREPVRRLTPGLPFESPPREDLPAVSRSAQPELRTGAAMQGIRQDPRSLQQQRQQQQPLPQELSRQLQQQQLQQIHQQQQRQLLEERFAQQAQAPGTALPAWAQAQGDRQAQLQLLVREQQLQQLQHMQQEQQRQQLSDAQARLAGQQQPDAALQAMGAQGGYAAWAQFPGQQPQQWDLQRSLQAAAHAPSVPPQPGVGARKLLPCAQLLQAA